jgi:hypothetical protein
MSAALRKLEVVPIKSIVVTHTLLIFVLLILRPYLWP